MASLIGWLKFAGARLVTGLPVASGFARFYVPGSDVAVDIFADAAEAEPLTQPVTLDAAGRAEVYCAEPAEIAITTSTGASVGRSDEANTVTEDQVRATWGGSATPLSTVLTTIKATLDGASYALAASGAATPSFEFDPTADVNVFRCSYAGAVTGITITWPTPAPTISSGRHFTICFQFPSGTTLAAPSGITWGANIVEVATTGQNLDTSSAERLWSASFVKSITGQLCQASPWLEVQGDFWTV